ncbi:MAG: response regulator transcription factor [Acidobacteriota bacterium]
MRLGAQGLVLKESSPDELIDCVRRVHRGEQWIDRGTSVRAFGRVLRQQFAAREMAKALTPREIEIVGLIAQGLRNREIGERLFISEGTVKIHLHNIYEKLGVDGRLELLLYVQDKGLV